MRKLVMVITGLGGGGAEKVFTQLALHLRQHWSVEVVVFEELPEYSQQIKDAEIPIHIVPKTAGLFSLIKQLRRKLLSLQPDLVFSFLLYSNLISWLALRKTAIPLVVSERNNYRKQLQGDRLGWLKRVLLKQLYRSPTTVAVTAVSKGIAEMIQEDFGPIQKELATIPNGLDLAFLTAAAQEPLDENAQQFFQQHQVIIAVGRLEPQKNLPLLFRAFSAVLESKPQARLMIIGKGREEKSLRQLAEELKIDRAIVWKGFIANPHPWVAAADVYAMSSDFEGYPNALAEAMWTNGCCISTDCPTGPNDIIEQQKSGILVPTQNKELLAKWLLKFLDKKQSTSYRTSAQLWCRTQAIETTFNLYEGLLQRAVQQKEVV